MRLSEIISHPVAQNESARPKNSKPEMIDEKAYVIISNYVTHGEMASPSQFDNDFDKLWQILPRPKKGSKLYRVLKITNKQEKLIRSGGLALQARKYSSWTKNLHSLEQIFYDREYSDHTIIIQAEIPAENILVDVVSFYKKNHLIYTEEWFRYVRPEQEVIVKEPWDRLVVKPEMLVTLNTKEFAPKIPKKGEVFLASDGTREKISKVEDDQDEHSSVFLIYTEFGDPVYIRRHKTNGKWIETDQ